MAQNPGICLSSPFSCCSRENMSGIGLTEITTQALCGGRGGVLSGNKMVPMDVEIYFGRSLKFIPVLVYRFEV